MAAGGLLLILVLVLAAVIGFVAFMIGRRSRVRSVAQPCCANCLYPVAGLTSLSCPECGSDLRTVGILTPAMRRPIGPWLAIILWTLALPVPALVISGVFASFLMPERYEYEDAWRLTPAAGAGVDHIEFTASASSWRWPWSQPGTTAWNDKPDTLRFALFTPANAGAPAAAELIVDLDTNTWRTAADSQARPLSELDESRLGAWLDAASGGLAGQLAPPLLSLIDSIRDDPLGRPAIAVAVQAPSLASLSVAQSGSMSMTGPTRGAMVALLLFWVGLWLLVSVLLYRRQSRTATG